VGPVGFIPFERLAMALMLISACRREDVVRLGPQHFRDGWMTCIQAKNEHKAPVKLEIPVHPKLQAIINATPTKHLTFLTTVHGKPFTVGGFSGAFKDWCVAAGLPQCASHGLRKSSATRLAGGLLGTPNHVHHGTQIAERGGTTPRR
jgi:integrase/recombinase XerD